VVLDPERFDRLAAFKRISAAPTLVLAAAMLGSLVGPLILHLPPDAERTWNAVGWGAFTLFTLEFTTRWYLARRRGKFLKSNALDIAIIVLGAPSLLVHDEGEIFIRAARAVLLVLEIGKDIRHFSRARNFPYVIAVVSLAVIVCGSLEYHFESGIKGANVMTPGDGLWWAITTLTTVGYGDRYPITDAGRIIAVVLMVIGLAFTGVISAVFTSMILRKDEADVLAEAAALEARLTRLLDERIAPVREMLTRLDNRSSEDADHGP
jgi:voltage-gated potassium channel